MQARPAFLLPARKLPCGMAAWWPKNLTLHPYLQYSTHSPYTHPTHTRSQHAMRAAAPMRAAAAPNAPTPQNLTFKKKRNPVFFFLSSPMLRVHVFFFFFFGVVIIIFFFFTTVMLSAVAATHVFRHFLT